MGTIRSALALYDGMTGPLRSIHKALDIVLDSFEAVQDISSNAIDPARIQEAREELARAGHEMDRMEQNLRDAENAQDQFNGSVRDGAAAADSLGNKLKGILATVVSIAGVKSALGWVKENLELSDTQRNAENQLRAVLANMGVEAVENYEAFVDNIQDGAFESTLTLNTAEGLDAFTSFVNAADGNMVTTNAAVDTTQTMSAFDAIAAKASEIQGRGIYGDELMIAGAAELATYFSDAEAIMSMMDTLSNYAMGMTGGGALDSSAMVDYATNLGKIMTGAYDAMTKKGFEFTDAQKAVIEGTATHAQYVEALGEDYASMSEDMRAAAVINSIIAESWDGLYETMSNTPEGKIIQFNNTLGDMREVLGDRLYTVQAISTALTRAHAFAEQVNAAQTAMATGATFAETVAQQGLNAALLACPVMWVVMGIIAIIAVLYAAVDAYNKLSGTSVSATGIICGVVAAAAAFIGNLIVTLANFIIETFALVYNFVGGIAVAIGRVFNDPVGAIVQLFYTLADTVLGVLETLASAIDTIFGSNLAGAVQGWRSSLKGWTEDTLGVEVWEGLDVDSVKMDRFEYGAAYNWGNEFGKGVEDKVSGLFKMPTLDEMGFDNADAFNLGNTLDGIYGNTGDTAANTAAAADTLDYMDEDLAWMKDIAEREAINRYTTAEITVEQHNENHISKDADLDGIMEAWAFDFAEQLHVHGEGVHD